MALTAGQVPTTGYQTPNYAGAAEAGGMAGASPFNAASELIGQAKDYFKQQSEDKKKVKQAGIQIDAALKLFPDLAPTLQSYQDQLKDDNIPISERNILAGSISELIEGSVNKMRYDSEMAMKREVHGMRMQQAKASMQPAAAAPAAVEPIF